MERINFKETVEIIRAWTVELSLISNFFTFPAAIVNLEPSWRGQAKGKSIAAVLEQGPTADGYNVDLICLFHS